MNCCELFALVKTWLIWINQHNTQPNNNAWAWRKLCFAKVIDACVFFFNLLCRFRHLIDFNRFSCWQGIFTPPNKLIKSKWNWVSVGNLYLATVFSCCLRFHEVNFLCTKGMFCLCANLFLDLLSLACLKRTTKCLWDLSAKVDWDKLEEAIFFSDKKIFSADLTAIFLT